MTEESKLEFDKPYKMNIIKKAMISTQVLFDLLVHNKLDEIDKLLDYKLPKRIIQATDHFNNSILMAFLSAGHLKLAGKLITYFDEYIIYDQLNDNQNNVLHICCQKNSFINHYKYKALIDFFIKKLPSSLNLHNDVFKTPFFYSVENLDLPTFKTLMSLKVDDFTQKDIFSYNLFHAYYQHFNQLHASIYHVEQPVNVDNNSNSNYNSNYNYNSLENFDDIDESLHVLFEKLMTHNELLYEVDEQNLTPLTYALKYVGTEIYQPNILNIQNSDDNRFKLIEKQTIAHEHFIHLFEKQMHSIMKSMQHYFLHLNQNIDEATDLEKIPTSNSILTSTPMAIHGHHHEKQFNAMKNEFLLNEAQLLHIAKLVHDIAILKEKYATSFIISKTDNVKENINVNIYEEFHTMLLTFMASDYYQTHKKIQSIKIPSFHYEKKKLNEEVDKEIV
jgi:hypothetical protein